MKIYDYWEQLAMFVKKVDPYASVLRIPNVRLHGVAVLFVSNQVTYGSQCCLTGCCDIAVKVQEVTAEPPEPIYMEQDFLY
jgi:hypothetical protein